MFVATGFGFGGKSFESLKKHLASGRLNLVMTDITVREVKTRIRQSVAQELIDQRTYVNKAKSLFNSSLADVQAGLKKLDLEIVSKDLCDQFDAFLEVAKATIIETGDITVGDVLSKYFAGQPPFGDREEKKYEFPDAFAVQALSEWAEDRNTPMFVVSGDSLFQRACGECAQLILKNTINEVLNHVASDDEQLAIFVRTEIMKRIDEIAEQAKSEFEDRYYWVKDQDGDAQVVVTDLAPNEPEILQIDKEEALVQISIAAQYKAYLSYNDLDTASYDEGTLIYAEHRNETVEREQELTVQIEAQYEHMEPDTFEIIGVSLTSPRDSFGIQTQDAGEWPYK